MLTCLPNLSAAPAITKVEEHKLIAVYATYDNEQTVSACWSKDNSQSWNEPEILIQLPNTSGRWLGQQILFDNKGWLHVFLLNDAKTGVVDDHRGEGEIHAALPQQQRLDIWHTKSLDTKNWTPIKKIWQGYCGSFNSIIQMKSGRIVLPFSYMNQRTWSNRGTGLDAFWFKGVFVCTTLYSDDNGDTWAESAYPLTVHTPCIEAYGGCEPVILELLNGQIWMLIRTQLGRFYESFSNDGDFWSAPQPTRFLSSDSPAGLLRLHDKRIVLVWNKCLRYPYALGGRHVLHAAISDDDGKTWKGHREILRDPFNNEPPPPSGDYGTAYPFPVENTDGNVLILTGQSKKRVQLLSFSPDWLMQTHQETNFDDGMDDWSVFTCKGIELFNSASGQHRKVLSIVKMDSNWPATAIWNFPMGNDGKLVMNFSFKNGVAPLKIMLTDHFSVPFDPEDAINALYVVDIDSQGFLAGKEPLKSGRLYELTMNWNCTERTCKLSLDKRLIAVLPLLRDSSEVCYLRLKSEKVTEKAFCVEHIKVSVQNLH